MEVPGRLLCDDLALEVGKEGLGAVGVGPVTLVEHAVGGLVRFGHVPDGGTARCNDDAADTSSLAGLQREDSAVDGGGDHLSLRDREVEDRGDVQDVGRALNGVDQGLLVVKVSLDELKLTEKVTEGDPERSQLSFVGQVADSAADTVASVLEELEAGPRAEVAGNSGQGHQRSVVYHCFTVVLCSRSAILVLCALIAAHIGTVLGRVYK